MSRMEVDQRVMGPGAVVTGGGFAGGLTEAGLGQLGFRSKTGVQQGHSEDSGLFYM